MIALRIPNRSVLPTDFDGRQGVCQNLDCLVPLEPPYQSARLCLPGGTLETVLCSSCMPRPGDGIHPEMWLEVVAALPVLVPPDRPSAPPAADVHFISVAELAAGSPTPPAAGPPGKRRGNRPWTFRALARREPRLRDLLAEARAHHQNLGPVFCANAVWYGYTGFQPGLKERLSCLVGWAAERGGDLRTSEAYDVAYHTIYQALPDCRGRCLCSLLLGL
jgi:hypothetical protein